MALPTNTKIEMWKEITKNIKVHDDKGRGCSVGYGASNAVEMTEIEVSLSHFHSMDDLLRSYRMVPLDNYLPPPMNRKERRAAKKRNKR